MSHDSILELLAYFEDEENVYLVTNLCENGELFQYIQSAGGKLQQHDVVGITRQIIQGLSYIHSHNIIHRDLKLSNLLLTRDLQVVKLDVLLFIENCRLWVVNQARE